MKKTISVLVIVLLGITTFCMSLSDISSGGNPAIGRIYGETHQIVGWQIVPVPFVLVHAGSSQDISNVAGYYELTNLEIGQTYEVIANKFGYEQTHSFVEITHEEPEVELNILLTLNDTSKIQLVEQQMQKCK